MRFETPLMPPTDNASGKASYESGFKSVKEALAQIAAIEPGAQSPACKSSNSSGSGSRRCADAEAACSGRKHSLDGIGCPATDYSPIQLLLQCLCRNLPSSSC